MTSQEPTAPPDPFQLCGTTIEGKYRVASVVGDGGFGVVYRGVHKGFGELIAIKCLKLPQELDEKHREALLETLRDEGRLLHRLSKATSGIVQALDVGAFTTAGGAWVPFLVLEWLEGETLGEHLAGRLDRGEAPYGLAEGIRLLEPAARALAVAHRQKVAHRDVKPPNLFVTEVDGARTLKVLDFGIAKVLTETTAQLEATKQGPSAFTPRYGAPEQFNKQRGASGPWTDVFALALILVEVVTGKKALEGDDPTQLYIASADANHRPTLRARGIDAPDAVERVLQKALHVDPKERYAGAGDFWDALVEAAGMPLAARSSVPSLNATTRAGSAPEPSEAGARREPSNPTPRDHPALGATMPIESLAAARPAVVVENKSASPEASSSARGSKKASGDPMEETPIHARLPPASPTSRPTELTLIPKPKPKPKQRSVWPYVATLLAVGAGALYFTMRAGLDEPDGPPRPYKASIGGSGTGVRGKIRGGAAAPPSSSSAAQASGEPAASGSASAVPIPTPEDMVAFAPAKLRLGEGADARLVEITKPFFLDKQEVSTKAYLECVAARKCSAADKVSPEAPGEGAAPAAPEPSPTASAATPPATSEYVETWSLRCNAHRRAFDHPINCVDFRSADAYCRWKERRLPTEAEWELAARGADARSFPWGGEPPTCQRACFDKNGACLGRSNDAVATCAFGEFQADRTPEGVLGLGGNVSEWVADGFASPPPGGADPLGDPKGAVRVVRGGNFFEGADRMKTTGRTGVPAGTARAHIGFRCAMDAAPP